MVIDYINILVTIFVKLCFASVMITVIYYLLNKKQHNRYIIYLNTIKYLVDCNVDHELEQSTIITRVIEQLPVEILLYCYKNSISLEALITAMLQQSCRRNV